MYLDKHHPVPIYLQLKGLLQNQIEQGAYFPHQKLPSERDLCKNYNLSRMTARRALRELIDEGLAYTRVGKGTFVSDKINLTLEIPESSTNEAYHYYHRKLTEHLSIFDCSGVEQTINKALAVLSVEVLALEIFPELIRSFEQRWQTGEISLLGQRYVNVTLRSQLIALVNAATLPHRGPRVLLATAPEDQHEIGLLLLALSLKRRGFRVTYLGESVATAEFQEVITIVNPQLICASAATTRSAQSLATFSHKLGDHLPVYDPDSRGANGPQKCVFTFGGVAFNHNPALASKVAGFYLGQTIASALTKIQQFFTT